MNAKPRIHFDHAATAPMREECVDLMAELASLPLNASSVHGGGRRARRILEDARTELAKVLNADPEEVVFTSGATEAANIALRGMADAIARRGRPMRIATSMLEHPCVRETIKALAQAGRAERILLPVYEVGRFWAPNEWNFDVITLMAVHNETGMILPIEHLEAMTASGVWFFCDATQALGRIGLDLSALGVWLAAFSSHKIGGPAGVGALVGPGVRHITPLMTGGSQEHELRPGTQPVALCAAFARAATLAAQELESYRWMMEELESLFLQKLMTAGVLFRINGRDPRVPGLLNISVEGLDGPDLVIALDAMGYDVSSGAACSSGVMEVSPALNAMFPDDRKRAAGALRISMGRGTTAEQVEGLAAAIAEVAARVPRVERS